MAGNDHADAVRYAFLASAACRALDHVRAGAMLTPRDAMVLGKASALLQQMRTGTAWLSQDTSVVGYTADALPAAERALSTMEAMQEATRAEEVVPFLEALSNEAAALAAGRGKGPSFASLHRFFQFLSVRLTDEAGVGANS